MKVWKRTRPIPETERGFEPPAIQVRQPHPQIVGRVELVDSGNRIARIQQLPAQPDPQPRLQATGKLT